MAQHTPIAVDKKPPQSDRAAALISHEQARDSLAKLVNSAFRHGDDVPKATFSIPVRDSDDDVVLMAYIAQQEHRERLRGL